MRFLLERRHKLQLKTMLKSKRVDYDKAFTPITLLDAIRLLPILICLIKFKLYQMDDKCSFLNNYLEVKVSHDFSNDVNNMVGVIVKYGEIFVIVQIYVNDIVFQRVSSNKLYYFVQQMQVEFEMSRVDDATPRI